MASIGSTILGLLSRLTGSKKVFSYNEENLKEHIINIQRKKESIDPPEKLYKQCDIIKEQIGSNYYFKVTPNDTSINHTDSIHTWRWILYGNHFKSLGIHL